MGRPKEHDERIAAALLEAAERAIEQSGPEAISIRRVAQDVGTTTRAVYSVFGCKQGLIDALSAHAFDLLREGIKQLATTSAPDDDLVEAGLFFRQFAIDHPSLFRITFQNTADPPMRSTPVVQSAAKAALDVLKTRVARLKKAGLLEGDSVDEATLQFHALCEGLTGLELRGAIPHSAGERVWRRALDALVRGLAGR